MPKRSKFLQSSSVILIILASLITACGQAPPPATLAPGSIETAAAQTIAADMQQRTIEALQVLLTSQAMTIAAPTATLPSTQTPLPTDTLLPTATSLPPTLIPTIAPPTAIPPPPTPNVPVLIANVDTRCRRGPSTSFDILSYILVGQQAEVLGRNPELTWWLIRDPRGQYGSCWVWGETTQLLGEPNRVPIVEPPTLPTPVSAIGYGLTFSNIHNCGGIAVAVFKVVNTGTETLQSSSITIMDITHDTGLSGPETSNSPFMNKSNSCPSGHASLLPGETAYLGKGMGLLPPSGTRGRGIILLCTKPGLDGKCLENRTTFTFP
jgi:hypothetical protein